jgi:hypothetical protein
MKISQLFKDAKSICREMLWEAGLQVVTIDKVEVREAFLPGRASGEMKNHLVFRGIAPGLVIQGRKLKFLVRTLGGLDTTEWRGKQIGIYVDKTMKDRKGGGAGSIQFAVGPDFWADGNYSGKEPPPRNGAKRSDPGQPPPAAADPDPPEAIESNDEPSITTEPAPDPDNDGR